MIKVAARVLRADSVKVEGRVSLDLTQTHPHLPKAKDTPSVQPQVRILENHPDFAVIEIICSCGTKTNLRCEYATAESSADAPQTQNPAPGADADSPSTPNAVSTADQIPEQIK